MKDRYYWLMRLAYKMCMYYDKKYEKWSKKFWKWNEEWKNKYANVGGQDNADTN